MVSIPATVPMPCWLPDRSQPHYVSALNGILDMDAVFAGKDIEQCLLPHTPEWLSAFRLDYQFDPDADASIFLRFLQISTDGDQEKINLLQEWAGYLLTTQNDLQKFLVLEGPGGNGKSVYFAAMTAMLGKENVSSVSIEGLGKPFHLSATYGKAANITGDTGQLDQIAEGILKEFTGGDMMMFEKKRQDPFMARPTAKLMAAWNEPPRIRDRSDGLWRRMILVSFDHKISEEEKILGMDNPDWWIRQGEVPGILNWAIVGLDRLRNKRKFSNPNSSQEMLDKYRLDSNPTAEFMRDYIVAGEGSVECSIVYRLYKNWCLESGYKPLGNSGFGKELAKAVPGVEHKRAREGKNLTWKYVGINFLTDEICGKSVDGSEKLF
jgi:putative DNA primase/helicase